MALTGVKFRAYPSREQKKLLSQWMGCARFVWNAKCEEQEYFYRYKVRFCPINKYPPIDQSYSQFKHKELSPWLYACPSIILSNAIYVWKNTFSNFLKGKCGKPQKKHKGNRDSVWLTSALFRFDGNKLYIGSKKFDLGSLSFKAHRAFEIPKSIRIKKEKGRYSVSFCYDDLQTSAVITQKEHLKYLAGASRSELEKSVIGVDRGVKIPVHTGEKAYDFSKAQKRHQNSAHRKIKRLQKRLSRQMKGSNRRAITKMRLGRKYEKGANIRKDFAHQTSYKLINDQKTKVVVFEDLKTASMTKKPRPKQDTKGRYIKNNAKAKAGLNKAILQSVWHMLYMFCSYKADKFGKAIFKVSPSFTSQECADCGHIHPQNRQTQSRFVCLDCGHEDNADRNAALVIKKRAINLILDSGTELSSKGVLSAGRYRALSQRKTVDAYANAAKGNDASKMIERVAIAA